MNHKAKVILKSLSFGIFLALIGFITFGGVLYGKSRVDARDAVDVAIEDIKKWNDKGLYGLRDEIDTLEEKKNSLDGFVSYKEVKGVHEYAEDTKSGLEAKYYQTLESDKKAFVSRFEEFQSTFVANKDLDLPSEKEFEFFIFEYSQKVTDLDLDLKELVLYLDKLAEEKEKLDSEINDIKKKNIYEELEEKNVQAEELLTFFLMRGGYDNEVAQVEEYQRKAKDIMTVKKYKEADYKELENLLNDDLYKILSRLEERKVEIKTKEQEKRAAWVKAEEEKWANWGLTPPQAPVDDVYQLIYINLASQTMYAYEDSELIHSTLITSGKVGYETPKGEFAIYYKASPARLKSAPGAAEQYDVHVDYWMPFYSGYGIHDSCNSVNCWRSIFGYNYYIWGGSHGCINTPYNSVKFLYNWAKVGTTVYID